MVVPNKLLLYYLHLFILLEAIKHCKVHDFGEEDILLYIPFADLWNNLKNLARLIYRNLQITNKTNMIPVWSQLLEKTGENYIHTKSMSHKINCDLSILLAKFQWAN